MYTYTDTNIYEYIYIYIMYIKYIGTCFYSMGELEQAIKHMRQTLQLDPDNSKNRCVHICVRLYIYNICIYTAMYI
jgi:tetratricopeptide (TPR) repeat protein